MARTQTGRRSVGTARRPGPGRRPATNARWGRSQPAARSGGNAKKGMLMAAAPMIGGLVMKKMRSRKQAKQNAPVV